MMLVIISGLISFFNEIKNRHQLLLCNKIFFIFFKNKKLKNSHTKSSDIFFSPPPCSSQIHKWVKLGISMDQEIWKMSKISDPLPDTNFGRRELRNGLRTAQRKLKCFMDSDIDISHFQTF